PGFAVRRYRSSAAVPVKGRPCTSSSTSPGRRPAFSAAAFTALTRDEPGTAPKGRSTWPASPRNSSTMSHELRVSYATAATTRSERHARRGVRLTASILPHSAFRRATSASLETFLRRRSPTTAKSRKGRTRTRLDYEDIDTGTHSSPVHSHLLGRNTPRGGAQW